MENKDKGTAQNAVPRQDWQDWQDSHPGKQFYAAQSDKEPDPEDEEEDDDTGDWGHVDPLEGNSPFPDSNDPTAPGSAV